MTTTMAAPDGASAFCQLWRCGPLAPEAAAAALTTLRERVPNAVLPRVALTVQRDTGAVTLYMAELGDAPDDAMRAAAETLGARATEELPKLTIWMPITTALIALQRWKAPHARAVGAKETDE